MAEKAYYSAQEAMKRLGLAKSTFYDYVKEGKIPQPQLPPLRQRGAMFPAKEIDELADAIKGLIISYDEDQREYIFRVARSEDATALSKFSEYIFERVGGYGAPSEIFAEWAKNPRLEIVHILLHKGKIAGYFTTHPLHHEQIMEVLNRRIRLRQIPVEQYAPLEPEKPFDMYIGDLAADPDIKQVSVHLIGKMLAYFHNLGRQGIEIDGIYALASTREGINICRRVGMEPMNLPSAEPSIVPFELKMQETMNKFTEDYIKALRAYKKKRQRLR
jgi:predicted DNA-binding transcriptional regulator AlpA